MIEIRIPIPLEEYDHVLDDLEKQFNDHGIVCLLSADTVIRTWATLRYYDWFDKQGHFVDHFIGYGEIEVDWQSEPMLAAVSHDFVDEVSLPSVVMMFNDEACDMSDYSEETANMAKNLALMFKLAHGGQ